MSDDGTTGNFSNQQGTASSGDVVTALQGMTRLLSSLVKVFQGSYVTGTFTLAAAASTTVTQPEVKSSASISFTPTNASAALLEGSNKALYISAVTPGASFTVTTSSGGAAAGTETFSYLIKNVN
jgi:hypothetical protein